MNRCKCLVFGILLLVSSLTVSCSTNSIRDYEQQGPAFQFESFFNGQLEATGFFQDRSGKVVRQIHCLMNATWNGDEVTIDEKFTYSDGATESRVWKIKKLADGTYVGQAGDVDGEAKIQTAGVAFNMKYILKLKVGENVINVKMDDWMFKANEKLVLNKTKMSKWGFHLGDVTLAIIKK